MMIWDIIRDFFVQYVFGGYDSVGDFFSPTIGLVHDYIGGAMDDIYQSTTVEMLVEVPLFSANVDDSQRIFITIGDYLSTTATIIVMVLLCILLVKLAIWIFKLGANLIRLR